MGTADKEFLDKLFANLIKNDKIHSAVLCVESGDGRISWTGAAGNMQVDSRYFITSVTGLYVTVIVMRLVDEKAFNLDDSISKFLPEEFIQGLHVLNEVDYSSKISIRHLISNTSGLPGYFFGKGVNDKSAAGRLLDGNDEPWDEGKKIGTVKQLKPKFRPGTKGKAFYSDTNYHILGKIIELVTGKPMGEVFREYIFDPLNLRDTYLYSDPNDNSPVPFYYKSKKLWLPKFISSTSAGGGIVSTASECMIFLKAVFQGHFFLTGEIEKSEKWNWIFPPPEFYSYNMGMKKFWVPRLIAPFKSISEISGFQGLSGSYAWYNPDTDLYFCGTTNQVDSSAHDATKTAILKMIKKAW